MRLPSALALTLGIVSSLYAPSVFAATPEVVDMQAPLTRAAFVQLVIDHLYTEAQIDGCFWDIASTTPPTFTLLYSDVPVTASYAKQLCVAFRDGFARGYADGSFRPNQIVSFAEASKIVARANHLMPYADAQMKRPWYRSYIESLAERNAIPATISSLTAPITFDQTIDMMNRLDNPTAMQTSLSYEELVQRTWPPVVVRPKASTSTPVSLKPKTGTTSSSSSSSRMSIEGSSSSTLPWYKLF